MYIVTEPGAEQELFSDSSEGSDEILNLSSLSDSEPEDGLIQKEDLENTVFDETHLGNNRLKVLTCRQISAIREHSPISINIDCQLFLPGEIDCRIYNKGAETSGICVPYMKPFIMR